LFDNLDLLRRKIFHRVAGRRTLKAVTLANFEIDINGL
jgi:hypothetical protein